MFGIGVLGGGICLHVGVRKAFDGDSGDCCLVNDYWFDAPPERPLGFIVSSFLAGVELLATGLPPNRLLAGVVVVLVLVVNPPKPDLPLVLVLVLVLAPKADAALVVVPKEGVLNPDQVGALKLPPKGDFVLLPVLLALGVLFWPKPPPKALPPRPLPPKTLLPVVLALWLLFPPKEPVPKGLDLKALVPPLNPPVTAGVLQTDEAAGAAGLGGLLDAAGAFAV